MNDLFAPSQYAQGTSTVHRPITRAPKQAPKTTARSGPSYAPAPGAPGDSSSDLSSDSGQPRRNGGNAPPPNPPNRNSGRPPPPGNPPRIPYNPPPNRPPSPPGPPGGGSDDEYSWFGQDDQGAYYRYYVERKPVKVDAPHIEMKLKPEHIEEWDGDTDKILLDGRHQFHRRKIIDHLETTRKRSAYLIQEKH